MTALGALNMPHHLFTAKRNTAKYIFHGILQIGIGLGSTKLLPR